MTKFLVWVDNELLHSKLATQERDLARRLTELEGRVRYFQERDRPQYDSWLRIELGPMLVSLEELYREVQLRRSLARRIDELIARDHLHPREALYLAQKDATYTLSEDDEEDEEEEKNVGGKGGKNERATAEMQAEETRARKRAKLEAKREQRRSHQQQAKREARLSKENLNTEGGQIDGEDSGAKKSPLNSLRSLYRILARKLHPDSPFYIRTIASDQASRLWHEVQAAYQTGEADRLLSLVLWIEDADPSDSPVRGGSASERVTRIRSLEKAAKHLDQKIRRMSKDPAWDFGQRLGSERKKLLRAAELELRDEFIRAQDILEALEELFASIGPPRRPSSTRSSAGRKSKSRRR